MITVGSLFSGIGGLDLGLEQAGMKTVWQVEFDDWARGKLEENFPHTEKFKDVREVGKHNLRPVDLIAGGFPCQDVSDVGKRAGITEGTRSGLWSEFNRIICELRPRYILVENVAALLGRGLGRVLGDLAAGGYDAAWDVLPAAAFGAGHIRERVFLVGMDSDTASYEQRSIGEVWDRRAIRSSAFYRGNNKGTWWETEPAVSRMVNGFPDRLRIHKAVGNAVCPPVAKWIGERIIEFDKYARN